jgi:hypothetical protein
MTAAERALIARFHAELDGRRPYRRRPPRVALPVSGRVPHAAFGLPAIPFAARLKALPEDCQLSRAWSSRARSAGSSAR